MISTCHERKKERNDYSITEKGNKTKNNHLDIVYKKMDVLIQKN